MTAIATRPAMHGTFLVPAHDCHDESVRGMDEWRCEGWRCRSCLRRTPGPGRILTITDQERES